MFAAAIIMSAVFFAFLLTPDRVSKEFGLLLAVAILCDALIMRLTVVPALLTLLGEKSWYIPRGWTGSCRTSRSSRRSNTWRRSASRRRCRRLHPSQRDHVSPADAPLTSAGEIPALL